MGGMNVKIIIPLALALSTAACGPIVIDLPGLGSGGGTGDSGTPTPPDTASGGVDSTGTGSTSDADSTSGTEGIGSGSDSESSSDTGEGDECVLPHGEGLSWCAAAREVAQAINCAGWLDPESCYQAVAAQYVGGTTALLAAGDCDTSDLQCVPGYQACTNSAGPPGCLWAQDQGVAECVARAGGAPEVMPFCEYMAAAYDVVCAEFNPYMACDVSCALPCAYGLSCLGPAGQEACTEPCQGTAAECPATGIPAPWDQPICDESVGSGLCALPCDAGDCPSGGWECLQACWPAV